MGERAMVCAGRFMRAVDLALHIRRSRHLSCIICYLPAFFYPDADVYKFLLPGTDLGLRGIGTYLASSR